MPEAFFPFDALTAQMVDGATTAPDIHNMMTFVTVLKVVSTLAAIYGLSNVSNQPFHRNIFLAHVGGNILKFVTVAQLTIGLGLTGTTFALIEDYSFMVQLGGLVVPMCFQFMWALSRVTEVHILLRHDASEADTANKVLGLTLLLWITGAVLRVYLNQTVTLHFFMCTVLTVGAAFLAYCLVLVRGTSKSATFISTYNRTFYALCAIFSCIIGYQLATATLLFSTAHERPYLVFSHAIESVGTFFINGFYAFLDAKPSDLKDHTNSMAAVSGVLKAKAAFKKKRAKKAD